MQPDVWGKSAKAVVIQYSGSVKPENASGLLRQPDADGTLVGEAILNAKQFLATVRAGTNPAQPQEGLT